MTLDPGTIATAVGSGLILWFLKDNTTSNRALREEVIILKTQLEFIKAAVQIVPPLRDNVDKLAKDLNEYFNLVKKIQTKLNIKEFDL